MGGRLRWTSERQRWTVITCGVSTYLLGYESKGKREGKDRRKKPPISNREGQRKKLQAGRGRKICLAWLKKEQAGLVSERDRTDHNKYFIASC